MLRPVASLSAIFFATASLAGIAPVWEGGGTFVPSSTTAEAITGPVTLGVDAGGELASITFGPGVEVGLRPVAHPTSNWLLFEDAEVQAEVLELASDPGPLLNDNRLCGGPEMPARWLVLAARDGEDPVLQIAVFTGDTAPESITADTLCGTYNYGWE